MAIISAAFRPLRRCHAPSLGGMCGAVVIHTAKGPSRSAVARSACVRVPVRASDTLGRNFKRALHASLPTILWTQVQKSKGECHSSHASCSASLQTCLPRLLEKKECQLRTDRRLALCATPPPPATFRLFNPPWSDVTRTSGTCVCCFPLSLLVLAPFGRLSPSWSLDQLWAV